MESTADITEVPFELRNKGNGLFRSLSFLLLHRQEDLYTHVSRLAFKIDKLFMTQKKGKKDDDTSYWLGALG